MSTTTEPSLPNGFVDRRANDAASKSPLERRQFGNSHAGLSPEARELAESIDSYKLQNRRRYITFEEMLNVIYSLGYSKNPPTTSDEPTS